MEQSRGGALDDEMLIAYLDGELGDADRARVEAAKLEDEAIAERLRLLSASAVYLRDAFDVVLREPVPDHLLLAATGKAASASGQASGNPASDGAKLFAFPSFRMSRIVRRRGWVGLAAAASVACVMFGSGYLSSDPSSSLLDNIAGYHHFLISSADAGENTVFDVTPESERKLPGDIHVPDLTPWGLAFQGARKTVIEGQPAYQFYYRGDKAEPGSITLALWDTQHADSQPVFDTRENVNLMHWRHGGRGFAIVGHANKGWMWGLAQDVAYQLKS